MNQPSIASYDRHNESMISDIQRYI